MELKMKTLPYRIHLSSARPCLLMSDRTDERILIVLKYDFSGFVTLSLCWIIFIVRGGQGWN